MPPRLRVLREFDPWRSRLCTCPPKYSLHPYTGCSHLCLYCYATSYLGRKSSTPKRDFLRRLALDLKRANKNLPVAMSTSSDPYPPEEAELRLARKTLELLLREGYRVLIVTKSDLVTRDFDLMRGKPVSVSITITTLDRKLAKLLEPHAPPPSARLSALHKLARAGIPVSARVDPVIPLLNDDPEELRELVAKIAEAGASHVVTSAYKAKPDNLARLCLAFPDCAAKLRELYYTRGERVGRYRYLRRDLRITLLRPVVEEARRLGLTYATCREGLLSREFFSAPTCDGTHLLYREAGSAIGL